MRLVKREEEKEEDGLFLASMRCGLLAAVAHSLGLVVGEMAVGFDKETGKAFYNSDLVETIKSEVKSGELFVGTDEDILRAAGVVMCAADKAGEDECNEIGWTLCYATCPEPAILSTSMGKWRLRRVVRGWWARQIGIVNEIEDDSTAIIEMVVAALRTRGSLTGAEIEAIITDLA